jgi:hypothetical protein
MTRRSLRLAAALAALLTVAGCGGDEEPPAASTTAPAAGAPSDAVVTWAGDVCSGADNLRGAVDDARGSTPPSLDASGAVPAQAAAEIKATADAVRTAGQTLVTTLSSPPPEVDAAMAGAQDDLAAGAARAQAKVDAMATAASAVTSATTKADAEAALKGLRSATIEATTEVTNLADELRAAMATGDPAVRAAFSAAPPCQSIS